MSLPTVVAAKAWRQFRNTEEEERLPLEAVTRGLVMTHLCAVVNAEHVK
jgi:hypothetical protein